MLRRYALAAAALLPLALALVAQEAQEAQLPPGTLAEEAIFDRQFARALELLPRAITEEPDRADYFRYLTAVAHLQSGAHDAALADIAAITAPPWSHRAAAFRAEIELARRGYAAAAEALRGAIGQLEDPARRAEIARIYVRVADELRAADAPNHAAIHRLLKGARDLGVLPPDEDATALYHMTLAALEAQPLYAAAVESAKTFLERYAADARANEMRLALGRAYARTGDVAHAVETFEATTGPDALWELAQLHGGATPGSPDDLLAVRRYLDRLVADHPDHDLAKTARYTRAVAAMNFDADAAIAELLAFARANTDHEQAPTALLSAGDLLRNQFKTDEAITAWDEFLRVHPSAPQWGDVQERIRSTRWAVIDRLLGTKAWPAARDALSSFLSLYPQDGRAPEASYRIGNAHKEEGLLDDAITHWRAVARRYPDTEIASRALFGIGQIQEDRGQLDDALATYRYVNHNPSYAQAQARIAAITTPSIAVKVERIFPTGARPVAKIVTRNLETFELTIHRVDVLDYFLRTGSTEGILRLEVAIAAPDRKEDRTVADYVRYRPFEHEVAIPDPSSGVYIVTARSGTFEAANAVIVSDLAFVSFLSRKTQTTLAIDLRRGEHLTTIPLRIAADGRLVDDPAVLPTPARVSLLAQALGNFAFRDTDLSQLPVAPEVPQRAAILADRQFYLHGEEVIARALVEPADRDYRLIALAPNGRPFAQTEGRPDAWGTIALRFRLPKDALLGSWTLRLEEKKEREPVVRATRAFASLAAAPRGAYRVYVRTEPEKPALGDAVALTVDLTDGYGRPARAMKLRWMLAATRWNVQGEALSDDRGRLRIDVPASPHIGAWLWATITAPDGSATMQSVTYTPPGFTASAELVGLATAPVGARRTFKVKTTPAAARTIPYTWTRTDAAGWPVEITRGEVTTNAEGEAELPLDLAGPGAHTLRLEGRDERGLPVVATAAAQAVEPTAESALALAADRAALHAGEEVEIVVTSLFEMPAWVATATDKPLTTQALRFVEGANRIRIHVPDGRESRFDVIVAGLRENRLHVARATFDIEKKLTVTLESDAERYEGGQEATLRIRVVDEAGRPTRARVHLVVAHAPEMELADGLFRCPPMGPFVIVEASNLVAMEGAVRTISEQILAAAQQLEEMRQLAYAPAPGVFAAEEAEHDAADDFLARGEEGGRFAGRRLRGYGGGSEPGPVAEPNLYANFDLETAADGTLEVRVRLPLERTTWQASAYAYTTDRAGSATRDLRIDSSLAFIAPPVARVGVESSYVVVEDGVERVTAFTPAEPGAFQPPFPVDPIVVLPREGAVAPAALAADTPFERVAAVAAELLASLGDADRRRRAARVAEGAVADGLRIDEAVPLAMALMAAKDAGEEIDPAALSRAVDVAAAHLARADNLDSQVLRRYLLSATQELRVLQLTPYWRQREAMSARSLALMALMYRKIEREEERTECLTRLGTAARPFDGIGVLDTAAAAAALAAYARGERLDPAPSLDGAGPFDAALVERVATLPATRPALVATLGTELHRHYPTPVFDGLRVAPMSIDGLAPRMDYAAPALAHVAAGEPFTLRAEIAAQDPPTWILVPVPDGCSVSAPGYDDRRHGIWVRTVNAAQTLWWTVDPLAPTSGALTVLAAGAEYRGDVIPEPTTLYALIELSAAKKEHDAVVLRAAQLRERATLTGTARRNVTIWAFSAQVARQDRTSALAEFEALKEIAPDHKMTRDEARFVARGYEETGDALAAVDLYRALADELFYQDALVAGEMQQLGRIEAALQESERILVAYPETDLTRQMLTATAEQWLRRGGRSDLRESVRLYRTFLGLYPRAPEHEEATFALANAYVALSQPPDAERILTPAMARYPEGKLKDGFQLLTAAALFTQKKFEPALAIADQLVATEYQPARLLRAHILHAQGRLAEALETYKAVAERFDDARRSVAFLERSGIQMPMVSIARTDEARKIEIETLGVGEVDVKLYKIDLMQLYLRAEGEVDPTDVPIAGIRPVLERRVALAGGDGAGRRKSDVELAITDPGAYYVTMRSGSFRAGGVLLVSDLTMEVQDEPSFVRVYIADSVAGAAAGNVRVAFISQASPTRIQVERTDLRGVSETRDIRGMVTVVAERDGHYAVHRLATPVPPQARPQTAAGSDLDVELQNQMQRIEDRRAWTTSNWANPEQGIRVRR